MMNGEWRTGNGEKGMLNVRVMTIMNGDGISNKYCYGFFMF